MDENKKVVPDKGAKKRRVNKRIRRQKSLVTILLTMIVIVGGYRIYLFASEERPVEDIKYTSLVFQEPFKQSLDVLVLSQKEDGSETLFNNENKKIEYSDIKNYKEENLDRYVAYHALHEDLLDAEVIWRVNVNFDYVAYENVSINESPMNLLAIINKNLSLSSDFEPDDLVAMTSHSDLYLRSEANSQFDELLVEIAKTDLKLGVNNAYVSFDDQKKLYDEKVSESTVEDADKSVDRAGHSEHQLGLALDVNDGSEDTGDFGLSETYGWLKNNAHRFGFIIRYRSDESQTGYKPKPSHLRYVGKEVAVDMYESNVNILEEYLDKHGY